MNIEDNIKSILKRLNKFTSNSPKAIAYEKITLTPGTVKTLTVPANANYAKLRITSALTTVCAYYLEHNQDPSVASVIGIPLMHLDIFDVTDTQNLSNFKIDGDGILHVQYFNMQF